MVVDHVGTLPHHQSNMHLKHAITKKWVYLSMAAAATVLTYTVLYSGLHEDTFVQNRNSVHSERTNIFFLKTHKCASSTIQNILMRYGFKRHLNFVLPGNGNYLGSPKTFDPDMIGRRVQTLTGKYNIFTHHTRLNVSTVAEVMYDDAAKVTILREPIDQYESLYSYYELSDIYRMTLSRMLKMPLDSILGLPRVIGRLGFNQMLYDMGMDEDHLRNTTAVANFIDDMHKFFDLVMISEYMEASLILLKELMGWTMEDISFRTLNARPVQMKIALSPEEQETIRILNKGDQMLYRYFLRIFKEKLHAFGTQRILLEVDQLLSYNQILFQNCSRATSNSWQCPYLLMEELTFTDVIRDDQFKRMRVFLNLDKLLVTDVYYDVDSEDDYTI